MELGSFRRSLFLAVVAGASALAVAAGCSAPYRAKDALPTCDDGDPGCNGDSNQTPRKASNTSGPAAAPDTSSDPTEPETTTPTSSKSDAGSDAGSTVTKQPSCVKLEGCCDQLKQAGYTTDTCLGVVTTNNNSACYAQHKLYVEGGDCSW